MRAMWDSSGVRFIREMVAVYFDRRVSRSAAELAYFLILSFFPALICVNAFVGLLRLDVNLVLEASEEFLPQEVLPILGGIHPVYLYQPVRRHVLCRPHHGSLFGFGRLPGSYEHHGRHL